MVQIINCKCDKTFAACMEPDCYTDEDWTSELAQYVKDGYSVKMAKNGEWKFEMCDCKKENEL